MPPVPAVSVRGLRKIFKVPVREAGLRESMRSLFRRVHREVHAVDGVTFSLEPGEVVGFLGPNGAGKTTTLKMLSGLLYPESGDVNVLGHVPSKRERDFLKRIALVMGNQSSMSWACRRWIRSSYNAPSTPSREMTSSDEGTGSPRCSISETWSPNRFATCRWERG